ncbi:uncharacterized protein [Fopius arisanus]|nr:PREDICTED: uncharacterized protein LOC105273886 [Fopius arisanus]
MIFIFFELVAFTGHLVTGCLVTIDDVGTTYATHLEQVTLDKSVEGPWMSYVVRNETEVGQLHFGRMCDPGRNKSSEFAKVTEIFMKAMGIEDCEMLNAGTYVARESLKLDCGELEKYVLDQVMPMVTINGVIQEPPVQFAISNENDPQVENEVEYDIAHYLIKIEASLDNAND